MRDLVKLYFDCVSPWSYIAYNLLKRYRKVWDFDLELEPRSLPYIMKYAQNQPPMIVPNKSAQMLKELSLADRMYNVQVKMPSEFPFNTFILMGFLLKTKELYPENLESAVDLSFDAIWQHGRKLETQEQVRDIARECLKINEESLTEILEFAASRDARQMLSAQSQELVQQGAFGFPWIVATRSLDSKSMRFFGADRMENLAAFFHQTYRGSLATGETARL
ncbi:glutathione transferase [Malassezia psittaci]|uniref:Glutathione S-transferase kappa n=1 Tax=Malassezia psittaci TaxID=1821823 RepID=A0AAF0FBQ3_9BASI|nr:glutathione transferase [Malassezia psittaci]